MCIYMYIYTHVYIYVYIDYIYIKDEAKTKHCKATAAEIFGKGEASEA